MINKGKTPKRKPEPRNDRVASCSSSIKIRDMPLQITMKYYFTLSRPEKL